MVKRKIKIVSRLNRYINIMYEDKNLKIIYFNYNKLSNLNGIEGLNLVHIYVNSNELTDITAIIGMEESLETLSVKNNLLSSLPDMKNFNNLKLNLRYYETDFSYNKLLLKELNEKLPTQLSGYFNYWMQSQNPDLGELSLFDEDTGIEVDGTMDTDAALKVEKLENTFENSVATYDITLQKDGIAIQPDGAITIKIPSDVKDCKVMWLKDDGTAEDMNAKYTDGCYVFTTDHLSVYALVQDKTILTGDANQDGIVNVNDATYFQMHIAGKKNTDGSSLIDETNKQLFDCVDMNKDGKLSVADVTALQIYISQNN